MKRNEAVEYKYTKYSPKRWDRRERATLSVVDITFLDNSSMYITERLALTMKSKSQIKHDHFNDPYSMQNSKQMIENHIKTVFNTLQ